MIVLEGTIHIPLIYYPMFYLTQDVVMHNYTSLSRLWSRYNKNIWADYIAWSKFWPASLFVSITFLPNHLIPVFSAVVGLFWVIILSKRRGNPLEDQTCLSADQIVKFEEQANMYYHDDSLRPLLD